MTLVVTEAIVLHSFDYLESSRIIRLLTRDGGVQSVLARGARKSRKRFGSGIDLFAQGTAEYAAKPGRELHTLTCFDVSQSRAGIALDIARFTAASVIAELALRFTSEESNPDFFDAVSATLDSVAESDPAESVERALAGAWQMVGALGFAPALDLCANCHAPIAVAASAMFSHPAGGILCERCGRTSPGTRKLPADARATLARWLEGDNAPRIPSPEEARSHQRLLREFLAHHLSEGKMLPAFGVWERGEWGGNGVRRSAAAQ